MPHTDFAEHYTPVQIAYPMILNYFFSVSIVIVNKYLLRQWKFGTTLTAIHFTVTFLALLIMLLLKQFTYKKLPILKVIPLSITFCANIVLNNLSIQYNSIGFYQTMKIASMPMVCILEFIYYRKKFSQKVIQSLAIIVVGILLCTVNDFRTNLVGFIIGFLGAFGSALYVLLSRTTQKDLNCTSHQLLLFQCPLSALMLCFIIPFLENYDSNDPDSIWNACYTNSLIAQIIYTCIASVGVNISLFLITRRTSPLTYSVMSNIKTVSTLTFGILFFKEPLTPRKVSGMVLALVGVAYYSYAKALESGQIEPKK